MSSTSTKTLSKRIPTKHSGIYYKEVQQTTIDDHGKIKTKIIDKVYIIRYRDNGKERLVTLGKYSEGIREAYCKTKRSEFITLAKNGELPPQIEKQKKKDITTLDDIRQKYFDDKPYTPSKNNLELKYKKHIKPALGHRNVNSIESEDIIKLRKQLEAKSKAPNTINGIINLLSAIINYNIKHYKLNIINPCTHVSRAKADDKRERYLDTKEINTLLNSVKDDEQLDLFVKMALRTGARAAAILNIRKKDFDLARNTVSLKDFKGNKTYNGYLDDALKEQLTTYLKALKEDDHLIGGGKEPITMSKVGWKLRPILNRLFNKGLDVTDRKNRVVIHTLRHTFASHLAIKGTPIYTIQKLMNHVKIEMTLRYAKLTPDQGIEAVKGLYQ
ncbi:tyrosine-type recombinase/integrase [Sulfurovum sp. CS9]|uniref:tyrosine-type recombinase/integrase n=1 Tax=Sulfurovum sp. CS9 TaxID=3391146 RepID=UPI0039EAEDED